MNELASTASAQRYVLEKWISRNPDAWNFIEHYIMSDYAARRPVSISRAFEHARMKDFVDVDGDVFKINNNMRSAASRLLIEHHPCLRGKLKIRKAACDWAFRQE